MNTTTKERNRAAMLFCMQMIAHDDSVEGLAKELGHTKEYLMDRIFGFSDFLTSEVMYITDKWNLSNSEMNACFGTEE